MGRRITIEDAKRCYALIEQCTELWADADAWQNHLSSGAQALIGGCASVMGASRVAADGSVEIADASIAPGADATLAASFGRYVADGGFGLLPELPVITPLVMKRGSLAYRQSAVLSREDYRRSVYYRHYLRDDRVDDALSAIQVAADGIVIGLAIMRRRGDRQFTERDETVLALLTSLATERIGQPLTTRRDLGRHMLSPRLRETLDALLDGIGEKEIANRLGIGRPTAHEYVMSIYRRFGVRSRAELMAVFLRRRDPLGPGHSR